MVIYVVTLTPISGDIDSQPLNDNFSALNSGISALEAETVQQFSGDIYVSTTGDDGNDGLTEENAVATIQAAIDIWADNKYKSGSWTIHVAAGTYTEGAVADQIITPNELVIEGELSGGSPITIIDGTSAVNNNGLNFNSGVRARIKNIKVQDFSGSGIVFQNGSHGIIDTCDSENNAFVGFGANESSTLDIIGTCNIDVPTGAKGIRYYRQCSGSWSDAANTITIDGGGNVADGVEIRDNSYVVCEDGVVITECLNFGVLIRRHSYFELRTSTVSNNTVGIGLKDESLFSNATGVITFSGNTDDYDFSGFSLPYDTPRNTAVGVTGPSVQGISSGYDLIISSLLQTGLQFLTDSSASIRIDLNKLGRITYVQSDHSFRFSQNNTETYRMRTDAFVPTVDNTMSLGLASYRWSEVFAGTGTINTSDAREKQQIRTISESEKAVALRLKNMVRAFKFNDAVEKKGDAARIHFGVIAQEVKEAFEAEGLVAEQYAILCYDEWPEQQEVKDEEGIIIEHYRPAGSRYGVRYEELLAFIIATL